MSRFAYLISERRLAVRSVVNGVLKLLLLRMAFASTLLFPIAGIAQVQSVSLEEIVVTARNWEESLRDVPITMNAFSEEDIERLNIMDLSDLAALTTSVEYVSDNGNPFDNQLIIRGGGVGRPADVDRRRIQPAVRSDRGERRNT